MGNASFRRFFLVTAGSRGSVALRLGSAGVALSGPLHPPRGDFQSPLVGLRSRPSELSLEGLRAGSKQGRMTLAATEFLRRFFLHVLPKGFVRIRHFGFLANRFRVSRLALCRQLLADDSSMPQAVRSGKVHSESPSLWHCPRCGATMLVVQRFTTAELPHAVLRFFLAAPSPTTLGCAPARRRTRVSTVCQSPPCHLSIALVCHSTDDPRPSFGSFPALHRRNLTPGPHSNSIGPRPPRQRLPPSLLIENASVPVFRPRPPVLPEAFPIKASDFSSKTIARKIVFFVAQFSS